MELRAGCTGGLVVASDPKRPALAGDTALKSTTTDSAQTAAAFTNNDLINSPGSVLTKRKGQLQNRSSSDRVLIQFEAGGSEFKL
jgi:hypothetical protein